LQVWPPVPEIFVLGIVSVHEELLKLTFESVAAQVHDENGPKSEPEVILKPETV
jgi:hypothetical protein